MIDRAVVNSSPIIYLARANFLHLLKLAAPRVEVPEIVAAEITARGEIDPGARALEHADFLHRVETPPIPPEILRWNLGAGESAVLALAAARPGTLAILDDLQGRRCADTVGIRLRGTLGLVLRAQRHGVVPRARPVLDSLRDAGMFLSERVLNAALREIGE